MCSVFHFGSCALPVSFSVLPACSLLSACEQMKEYS
uniref:Uncharacterized protein n=1 Tax=Anguilla anguilla TaxID=7936 RepID=A0A0E9WEX3_ANGAN